MHICYIDESGTAELPGTTSHFILAGLSIPVSHWKDCDRQIAAVKATYQISDAEIHVGWMLRDYPEQRKIANFEHLSFDQRRAQMAQHRRAALFKAQKVGGKGYKQLKKTHRHTDSYLHLTRAERTKVIQILADMLRDWQFARLFAECIDKVHFDPLRHRHTIDEQAFEQVVSRFERYLQLISAGQPQPNLGLLIHDNNPTVAKKHTDLMKRFHAAGTQWIELTNLIETPLFVDSALTSMVQMADLCAYALRRYFENNEADLLNRIFARADRYGDTVVGVRHFTASSCRCRICTAHRTT